MLGSHDNTLEQTFWYCTCAKLYAVTYLKHVNVFCKCKHVVMFWFQTHRILFTEPNLKPGRVSLQKTLACVQACYSFETFYELQPYFLLKK